MKACLQSRAFMPPCGRITSAALGGKWEIPQGDTLMPRNQGRKEEIPQGDTLMPRNQGRKEEIPQGDTTILRKQERGRNGYDEEITAFVCTQ